MELDETLALLVESFVDHVMANIDRNIAQNVVDFDYVSDSAAFYAIALSRISEETNKRSRTLFCDVHAALQVKRNA